MKSLIAFIGRWFRRFCDRFSTYELFQPEEVVDVQRSPEEAAVSASVPTHLPEATDTIHKQRRHNGLDLLIARLRQDAEERKKHKLSKNKRHDYNY